MDPPAQPGPESGPPHRRLSSEARAARNEAIARRRLEGASVTEVMEEFSVSRNTVKRATRDHAASLARREPEELAALDLPDVEHLLHLGLTATGEGLRRCLEILRDGRRDNITIGAANAASRATSALIVALIRTGYLPEPGDEYLRRRVERMDEVWGVELARMAERAGLADEEFERMLGRVADDARFQSGLALITTNGREH